MLKLMDWGPGLLGAEACVCVCELCACPGGRDLERIMENSDNTVDSLGAA